MISCMDRLQISVIVTTGNLDYSILMTARLDHSLDRPILALRRCGIPVAYVDGVLDGPNFTGMRTNWKPGPTFHVLIFKKNKGLREG